ncbi:MAG: hypothetical protein WD226_10290 [Planctomycetota bacterium]
MMLNTIVQRLCFVAVTWVACGSILFADESIPGFASDPNGGAYDSESIYETIGDLFGAEREAEVRGLSVPIVELRYTTSEGTHDHDTIGVDSESDDGDIFWTLEQVAVIVEHEAKHVANARFAGTLTDPTTVCPPASGCVTHAEMHYRSATEMMGHNCEDVDCEAVLINLQAGNGWVQRSDPGAPGGPGGWEPNHEGGVAWALFDECCGSGS